jgi:hypothetical protein
MRFLRRTIALWLLIAFGACYAFPAVTAQRRSATTCCHNTKHGACCRKNTPHTGFSFWTASEDCSQHCSLPASLSGGAYSLLAPRVAFIATAGSSEQFHAKPAARANLSDSIAFLYQRPPPRS